jgi:exodeoxyribonuclease VII large subunit
LTQFRFASILITMPDLFFDAITYNKTADVVASHIFDDFLNVDLKAKVLSPQIDWVFTHKKAEYLGQLLEMRRHSSVQIRRKVAHGIGFLADKDNLEDLQKWQLAESDRETWLILESTIDKIQRKQAGVDLEQSVRVLSITEALNLVKRLIGEQEYILEGEISEVRAIKQMYSFSVKDKQESRLDCWVFGGVIIRAGFPLNEGLAVRITGKFKMSAKGSRIYFDVTKIQLSGEGELLRNLKLLEEKLRKEGLFDESRKRSIPKLPNNILLLASNVSAALSDFIKVIGQRRGGIKIYHLPIKTQGLGAESEVLEKLGLVNDLTSKYSIDTVVLTRGGGGADDLVVFNSEKVVRALHGVNRPTIVAIGHERDNTLVELAADLRASTPSQAAELSSLSRDDILQKLEAQKNFCIAYFQGRRRDYITVATNLQTVSTALVQKRLRSYMYTAEKTGNTITSFIGKTKLETQRLWQNSLSIIKINLNKYLFKIQSIKPLEPLVLNNINKEKQKIKTQYDLAYRNVCNSFLSSKNKFDLISSKIILHDPENILKKGYAIIKQNDQIIEKTGDLTPQPILIKMQDGEISR